MREERETVLEVLALERVTHRASQVVLVEAALDEVVLRSRFEDLVLDELIVENSENDEGELRNGAPQAQHHLESAAVRKLQIDDREAERALREHLDRVRKTLRVHTVGVGQALGHELA